MNTHTPAPFDPTRVPHLLGSFGPVTEEVDVAGLEVTGEIPASLDGLYLRNGPNPPFTPIGSYPSGHRRRSSSTRREFLEHRGTPGPPRLLNKAFAVGAYATPVARWLGVPVYPGAGHHGSRQVGHQDLAELWRAADEAQRWNSQCGGGTWRASSVTHCLTRRAVPLLHGSYTDEVGRGLFEVTAELARVAGWSAVDSGHHHVAQRHFIQALRMAKAGDADRRFGLCRIFRDGQHRLVLGLARERAWWGKIRWWRGDVLSDAAIVIEQDEAVRIVEEELERSHQAWVAAGVEQFPRSVVVNVDEHELVWKVYVQSEEYARTRNTAAMLVGHGPYLVDRIDGGLHSIGILSEIEGAWEDDYRGRIRGLPVRTPVDDLHDELRTTAEAAGGRMAAVRALRRKVAGLSPTHALAYVTGLLAGELPPQLLAITHQELVNPIDRVLAVRTHGVDADF
ncbi:YrhB domain-containing protein [Streptomyces sp. NPDC048507]|uniref:YrhB domain-containing protein n=1 Tax=Streptomyces sp. NPDC048507 TaxID=3365560 RepID=UPI003718810D